MFERTRPTFLTRGHAAFSILTKYYLPRFPSCTRSYERFLW